MADLGTRYLGLALPSPLFASSSPLTGSLDGLLRLEAAGARAVVLPSLFEEALHQPPHPGWPRPGLSGSDVEWHDLDIETLTVRPTLTLSTSAELGPALRWIAILARRHRPAGPR